MDNKKNTKKALYAFGLNEKEANLYLACLGNGSLTVQDAAKLSNVNRTTLYTVLDKLARKGVITLTNRSGKTFIEPTSPERLLHIFSERQELFSGVLPILQSLKLEAKKGPKIKFFKGKEGFKNLFHDLLQANIDEWLIITSGKEFLSFVSERYIVENLIKEKRRLGIKSRQIITDSPYAHKIIQNDKLENRESRIINPAFKLPTIEIIFGNSVAIISSNFSDLIMTIDSEEVAVTHRSYFELMWKGAEKV